MNAILEPIRSPELDDRWNAFRLKVWRKLNEVVSDAKAAGMEQKDIATRIGMDEAQLSRILSGRSNVTLRTMHNIARAIDYRPEIEFVSLSELVKSNFPSTFQFAPRIDDTRSSNPPYVIKSRDEKLEPTL